MKQPSNLHRQIVRHGTFASFVRRGELLLLSTLVLSALLLSPRLTHAQARNTGRLVVPLGYESYDSVRFSLWNMLTARLILGGYQNPNANAKINTYADSIQATFEGDFLSMQRGAVIGGKRKGTSFYFDDFKEYADTPLYYPFLNVARELKARTFYPQPSGSENFYFGTGNYWRYNDVTFNTAAKWYNNTYDANDISPYCEYPMKDAYVIDTFSTRNYNNTTDTLVHYGDKGRVILGYSDLRNAAQLLHVHPSIYFTGGPDTAQTFSTTLDVNIDPSIDTALSTGRVDSTLPLVVFQVLFKNGSDSYNHFTGQPVFPFVPFVDTSHSGWHKIAEVLLTKASYDSLDDSWKAEDTLQNGTPSHSWHFKQLHVILKNVPAAMKQYIVTSASNDWDPNKWGQGSGSTPITSFANPDQVVGLVPHLDTVDVVNPLLEIRVLSTYRATVRVRGLDYHDTIIDKFLYRKRTSDTVYLTHSCNPNGSIGGYDDSVSAILHSELDTSRYQQEFIFNDTDPTEGGAVGALSVPMIAYMDFMGSRHHLHAHWREQDDGHNTQQLRRLRMIFNGEPPSVFENQYTFFGGYLPYGGCLVFPQDYIYYSALDAPSIPWPSSNDTLVGIITARRATADPDSAYHLYENEVSAFSDYAGKLRGSARVALWHPNSKRFGIEAQLQNWAILKHTILSIDTIVHYNKHVGYNGKYNLQRPTTPEEILAMGFLTIAEGVSCFNAAQPIDLPTDDGGTPGVFGCAERTSLSDSVRLTHGYNVGHQYASGGGWPFSANSDVSGDLPNFYLGYSNSWRATNNLMTRINTIYDSTNGRKCPHPLKYMTWQDAYSNNRAVNDHYGYGDSVSKKTAFLKVTQTSSVKRYTRGTGGAFIDSTNIDSSVEVGLFKDSISNSLINRAAIIVNTKLYPSLQDTSDLNYYNNGLDTLSRCHSVYGDIDTRKVTMKIDTNQFESSFRAKYYVVRDEWHPDTCWLVCADSSFAIYLKPGDAKFLYFEKAIAIDAAPTATVSGDSGMLFNNGHRVAERMNGTKQVVTYTRGHQLYVATPEKDTPLRRMSSRAKIIWRLARRLQASLTASGISSSAPSIRCIVQIRQSQSRQTILALR